MLPFHPLRSLPYLRACKPCNGKWYSFNRICALCSIVFGALMKDVECDEIRKGLDEIRIQVVTQDSL